ncbi:hypothetical protein GRI69_01100 [Erythrobacter vulgaris]|uniref:Uncharacterized protein n=1 Tax=Qipengyuania vulgaris TaxID=291985 RepID=A0A844XP83_9SPHN|nr:hypothetical protein [Qipengyuania vulgaris]MXO46858.1 hypothetical protein [Qipengyuania vulgaris]
MNKKILISVTLKDAFIYNKKLHTGFYDGNYRRFIKYTIVKINEKTSYNNKLNSYYEIMDFLESTHLRISLSIPDGWDADRFIDVSIEEVKKNPSVDIILEHFANSSAEIEEKFFSYEWKGLVKSFR